MTDEALDANFAAIKSSIGSLEDLVKTMIQNQQKEIERHERTINLLTDRINVNDQKTLNVENKIDNHIENGRETATTRRFSVEMIVLVTIFALDTAGNWIQRLMP